MHKKAAFLIVLFLIVSLQILGQTIATSWDAKPWNAFWIKPGTGGDAAAFGVHQFRKSFTLESLPQAFMVHVSADQRYELYVNGKRASVGPARRDLFHWKYETVDLAPLLKTGKNVLAARIWNFGKYTAQGEMSGGNAVFILQGNGPTEELANTNETWKWQENKAYSPIDISWDIMPFYYVVGPGEQVDGSRFLWQWENLDYDDSDWFPAGKGPKGAPRKVNDSGKYMLVPSDIPPMEYKIERIPMLRTSTWKGIPKGFPAQAQPFQISANRKDTFLLDQTYLTNAYPELTVSGGKGAKITLRYAEALFEQDQPDAKNPKKRKYKGNRNEVAGKYFIGNLDVFLPDGGENRTFRPLWFRTWRYIQLIVETADQPLEIVDIRGEFTGFPLQEKGKFSSDQKWLEPIVQTGIRTARLCAHETYFDCPYYEQLQYVGDTRIQALASYYTFGEDRLAKQAIRALYQSRQPEGFTASRYPTKDFQIIPTFSLLWIGLLHDFWRYRDDMAFVKEMLPGTRTVLDFFAGYQRTDGTLKPVPWWNFTDWAGDFKRGVAPAGEDGRSAMMDLFHLHALQMAAAMEQDLGNTFLAQSLKERSNKVSEAIQRFYFDEKTGLYADDSAKTRFSQHVNTMAVLTDVCPKGLQTNLMQRTLTDKNMTACTIYFKYYLHLAAVKAGLGNEYLNWLDEWKNQLALGLTTWAEDPEPTRSDCHAWGCSPNIEFFRTVLGVDSDAPGFAKVLIQPHLGNLKQAEGKIPHPKGTIEVKYNLTKKGLTAEITLPDGLTGRLIWRGQEFGLKAGRQQINAL